MKTSIAVILMCLLTLAACSGKQDDSASAKTPAPPSGTVNVPKNNVFSPLVQDLNKAKQVNSQVQQQAKTADQAIENDSAPAAATNNPG